MIIILLSPPVPLFESVWSKIFPQDYIQNNQKKKKDFIQYNLNKSVTKLDPIILIFNIV